MDPVAEPVAGVLELEEEDPPVLVVLLVKVPVATEETASAVLVAAESVSHLATRGAALTAAAIKAKVETAFVNFILTDVYILGLGGKKIWWVGIKRLKLPEPTSLKMCKEICVI